MNASFFDVEKVVISKRQIIESEPRWVSLDINIIGNDGHVDTVSIYCPGYHLIKVNISDDLIKKEISDDPE